MSLFILGHEISDSILERLSYDDDNFLDYGFQLTMFDDGIIGIDIVIERKSKNQYKIMIQKQSCDEYYGRKKGTIKIIKNKKNNSIKIYGGFSNKDVSSLYTDIDIISLESLKHILIKH